MVPDDFRFSQASLEDYVACRRRFLLRYVKRLAWPAEEIEPADEHERHMRLARAFHRLIHQHLLGIPEERLSPLANEPDLRRWWHNYLTHRPQDLPPDRYPEISFSVELAGYRLMAKYDLVAVAPGERAVIVDWKTNRKPPARADLADRLQTRVYPYVLVRAGASLNEGRSLEPKQVEMIYWLAEYPHQPQRFAYNQAQFERDETALTALVEEIAGLREEDFWKTDDASDCRYCRYRSLCGRGIAAGRPDPDEAIELVEADEDLLPDFEQIAEIEY